MKITKAVFGIITITAALATQVHAQTFLTNGLIAYYPFNGNAKDASGNGHDGTNINATLAPDRFGVPNACYLFNGTNSHVDIGSSIQLGKPYDAMTISVWFLMAGVYNSQDGLAFTLVTDYEGPDGHVTGDYTLFAELEFGEDIAAGTKLLRFWNRSYPPFGGNVNNSPAVVDDNRWHSCVVVVDGQGTTRMCVDGVFVSEASYDASLNHLSNPFWRIGAEQWANQLEDFFNGFIDDVRIYNRALSTNEVQQLYAYESTPQPGFQTNGLVAYYPFNGNANDASGNGNNGTPINVTLAPDRFGVPNACYSFNGTNSEINIGSSITLGHPHDAMTLSVWFSLRPIVNPQFAVGDIVSDYSGPDGHVTGDYYFFGDLEFAGNGLGSATNQMVYDGDSYPAGFHAWGTKVLTDTAWHSCIVVVDGQGTIQMYVDGILDSTASYDSTRDYVSQQFWRIGASQWNYQIDNPFNGLIDDVRFYNRALSTTEVQQLYAYESTPQPIVSLKKAVKPSFANLSLGTNYQLQVSTDLNTWTNNGSPFTPTNSVMDYPQYFDVDNWGELFFRLEVAP